MVAAAVWFASPLALKQTTNGLETGPYVCAIAAVLLFDARWRTRSGVRAAVLGALLGVLFLVRNDAVFVVVAFLAVELYANDGRAFRVRIQHAAILGSAAFVIALPWLVYNAQVFGSIVPVSGRAESLNVSLGENIATVPRALAQYAWMATPLPARLAEQGTFALLTVVALLAGIGLTARQWMRVGIRFERWMAVLLIDGVLLTVYYGLFFGAA